MASFLIFLASILGPTTVAAAIAPPPTKPRRGSAPRAGSRLADKSRKLCPLVEQRVEEHVSRLLSTRYLPKVSHTWCRADPELTAARLLGGMLNSRLKSDGRCRQPLERLSAPVFRRGDRSCEAVHHAARSTAGRWPHVARNPVSFRKLAMTSAAETDTGTTSGNTMTKTIARAQNIVF
jgi:hypothetical protein